MLEESDPIVAGARRLCETLERIGDALVTLDTDTLLETEATLAQVLAAIAAGGTVHDRTELGVLVRRATIALARCRRLGVSFGSVAGTRLRLQTGVEMYGRHGGFVEAALSGSTVHMRT